MCVCTSVYVCVCLCTCACMCSLVPMLVRRSGRVYQECPGGRYLSAPVCCQEAHKLLLPVHYVFRRAGASPVAGRCIRTVELASLWPSGTHRNRSERQDETDGERERQELGEGRKGNFEECVQHRLCRTKHSSSSVWCSRRVDVPQNAGHKQWPGQPSPDRAPLPVFTAIGGVLSVPGGSVRIQNDREGQCVLSAPTEWHNLCLSVPWQSLGHYACPAPLQAALSLLR